MADRLIELHPVADLLSAMGGRRPRECPPIFVAPKAILCVHAMGDGTAMLEVASRMSPQYHVRESAARIAKLLRRASNGKRDPEPYVTDPEVKAGPLPEPQTVMPHPGVPGNRAVIQ
jgi:hypothetical protein